jgi:hypothetical protein
LRRFRFIAHKGAPPADRFESLSKTLYRRCGLIVRCRTACSRLYLVWRWALVTYNVKGRACRQVLANRR